MSFSLASYMMSTETEHGVVLLDRRSGRYWLLNRTGAHVLRGLLAGYTVDSLIIEMRERYPSSADRVEQDVRSLVRKLHHAKVVSG